MGGMKIQYKADGTDKQEWVDRKDVQGEPSLPGRFGVRCPKRYTHTDVADLYKLQSLNDLKECQRVWEMTDNIRSLRKMGKY